MTLATVICVGEQNPTGRATVQVHLFFNRHAKVLQDMEPIRDLFRLWHSLTGGLCVATTSIPADNLDFGMAAQPLRATLFIAILKDVDNVRCSRSTMMVPYVCDFRQLQSSIPMTLRV